MEQSTHFELNLVQGSDKVNPLTVDRPNYVTIDDQMYKNQVAGIQQATELKNGTVHAITCLVDDAVFIRFTATSDFTSGDTFTYNGQVVSAVRPDGTGLTTGDFHVNGTVLASVIGNLLTVYTYGGSSVAEDSKKLGGELPEYYGKASDTISTYVHSRVGNVNNIAYTGEGTGAPQGRVKITANFQLGDTMQVNGKWVTAYAGANEFIGTVAGQELVGKTLFFLLDEANSIINFNLGGGGNVTVEGLAAENVKFGKTITVKSGTSVVTSVIGTFSAPVTINNTIGVGWQFGGVVNTSDVALQYGTASGTPGNISGTPGSVNPNSSIHFYNGSSEAGCAVNFGQRSGWVHCIQGNLFVGTQQISTPTTNPVFFDNLGIVTCKSLRDNMGCVFVFLD